MGFPSKDTCKHKDITFEPNVGCYEIMGNYILTVKEDYQETRTCIKCCPWCGTELSFAKEQQRTC